MRDILGLLGIAIAFFMVIYLSYKGMNLVYVIVAACFVVIVTNDLPVIETFEQVIMTGIGQQAATLMAAYLFGALFGKVFIDTGAAQSLTNGLMRLLSKNASEERKRTTAIMVMILIGAVMCYVGVDTNASMVTMIGLATGLFSQTNIPRRFLPVTLIVSTTVGFTMPGSANMIPLMIGGMVGTSSMSGAIPGLIGSLFVFAASVLYLQKSVKKAAAGGEVFEYGPLEPVNTDVSRAPHPVLAAIPLILIPILYNAVKVPAWAAIAIALVASIVIFFPWMPRDEDHKDARSFVAKFWGLVNSLNAGTMLAAIAAIFLFNFSLGLVVSETPAFQTIASFLTGLNLPVLIILAISATILVGISGGPGGVVICAMLGANTLVPQFGADAAACHRIIVAATAILDTLPFGGGCVMIMAMTNIKMKEGYPPIFRTTILYTAIGLVIVTALLQWFPALA